MRNGRRRQQSSSSSGRWQDRGGQSRWGGGYRQFSRRRKQCVFCEEGVSHVDYKQVDMLRPFLTDRGKIRPQRQTGTCARHQRQLAAAVKRARHLALLPFVMKPRPPR